MTRRLAITGYYGFGNAGDDAILSAVDLRLRALGFDLTVITYPFGDTGRIRRELGLEAIDGRDLQACSEVLQGVEALLIGGGGIVQDYLPTDPDTHFTPRHGNLAFWTTMALLARTNGIPAIGYALGVGPLDTPEGRAHARLLFELLSLTIVRDDESARLVESLGTGPVHVAADPALLLEPGPDPLTGGFDDLPTGGRVRVCVSVREWGDDDSWQLELAGALDSIIDDHDADVVFLPFQQARKGLDNDALVATRVAARMKRTARRAVVATELTPAEKAAVVAGSDLVIGMRLHSILFAASSETPVVAVAYDPKVRIAMSQLGLSQLCVDLADLDAGAIVSRTADALRMTPEEMRAYRRNAGALRERAATAENLLAEFLRSPTLPAVSDEAAAVMSRAAVTNAGDLLRAEAERDSWHLRAVELADELGTSRAAYDKLAAQFQDFMDARAVRAVRSLWTLRDRVKAAPSTTADAGKKIARKVLPGPARRAIRSAIGPASPRDERPVSPPASPRSPAMAGVGVGMFSWAVWDSVG